MPPPWYDWVTWNPKTRICANINTEQGDVTNFIVAYEYKLRGSWETVAQFDHGPESPYGHDIDEEGLHMDLYKEGQKYRVVRSKFPYVPVNHAPRYCIEYIKRNHGALIERFEQWHNVNRRP
ncbi:hypothetical protein BRC91_01835 [Halobacteriales archaeon QS_4_62_28]|nr:MAG: hypothetical protein BRC91_01835 [Halobacteriales archaeon QS_4_62_28]